MFTRSLLAAGITAAFAIPGVALADDAPAAPAAAPAAPAAPASPLAKLLDGSGITMSDYFDVAYTHANNAPSDRVFDTQRDSITLHQFGLQIAKQPKEGFGGLLNVTAGADVPIFASYPYTNGSSQFDVTQAYGQYATGPWTVIAGKFTTLQGTEVIWAPSNNNTSRSILFGAIPFTHTGVRATFAASDTVSLIAGVNNGWDQVVDTNTSKTLELGATLTPIKPLSVTISDLVGKESATGTPSTTAPQGTRNSFNIVASYTVSDPLSVGIEYLNVSQSNFTTSTGGNIKAKYDGWALYGTYLITPAWRAALRLETLDDKDGFHFGIPSTKVNEGTLTLTWLASDNFELRGEVRRDHASNPAFADFSNATSLNQSLFTYGLEGIFKF